MLVLVVGDLTWVVYSESKSVPLSLLDGGAFGPPLVPLILHKANSIFRGDRDVP